MNAKNVYGLFLLNEAVIYLKGLSQLLHDLFATLCDQGRRGSHDRSQPIARPVASVAGVAEVASSRIQKVDMQTILMRSDATREIV